jgi:hypothetical protein
MAFQTKLKRARLRRLFQAMQLQLVRLILHLEQGPGNKHDNTNRSSIQFVVAMSEY